MSKIRMFDQESVHTVSDGKTLSAIVRRDPESKKHLVYLVKEATSDEIIALMKKKEGFNPAMILKKAELSTGDNLANANAKGL